MSDYQLVVIPQLDDLFARATTWNDLWSRSYTSQPTARAEGVAHWIRSFAQPEEFRALCVEHDGRLVAALPLVHDHLRGVCPVYKLPVNCWANSGDLLLDVSLDPSRIVTCLMSGLEDLSTSLFSFEEITLDAPQWTAFRQALHLHRGEYFIASENPVGVVDVLHDWDAYQRSWSSNHRGAIRRSFRKLEKEGRVKVERVQRASPSELGELMSTAFEIENRSWKGDAGSSILKSTGLPEYMLQEAQLVSDAGYLDLWFLYFNERPISFEYCHFAKGVCYSHKIGYEPDYARFGPGRMLRYLQLEQYHQDPSCRLFDMLGLLCDSKAKWATRTYQVGHLYASIGDPIARWMLKGYAWSKPRLNNMRGKTPPVVPPLGAAGCVDPSANLPISGMH